MAPRWTCPVCFSRFSVLCPESADSLLLGPRPLKVCFVMVYQASATLGSPQLCSFLYALPCVDSGPHPPFLAALQASFGHCLSPPQFLMWGSYLLETPTQSWVVHLPVVLSCSAAFTRSVQLHRGARAEQGRVVLGDTEDTSPSVRSILCIHWGTCVVFQLSKFSYIYLSALALAGPWVCSHLSLSRCSQECNQAQPAFLDFHTAACGCFW